MTNSDCNKNIQDTPPSSFIPTGREELLPDERNEPDEIGEKSEEVQAIIDRMPTYWVKWVVLCVGVLMSVILLLGFLIRYPDTVDGQISVTATTAPVRLVANRRCNFLLGEWCRLQAHSMGGYRTQPFESRRFR